MSAETTTVSRLQSRIPPKLQDVRRLRLWADAI
jgi:hypothetical protein